MEDELKVQSKQHAMREPEYEWPPPLPVAPQWERDPSASGWRSRMIVNGFELIAYDDGRWRVNHLHTASNRGAYGVEPADGKSPQARAIAVYKAMSSRIV